MQRGREQGQHVVHALRHHRHLGHVGIQHRGLREALLQRLQRRGPVEIVEREDQLDVAGLRNLAHFQPVGRVVAHLEVDHVDVACLADGAVERDHLPFRQRDPLAAFARRTPREKKRDAAGGLLDAAG